MKLYFQISFCALLCIGSMFSTSLGLAAEPASHDQLSVEEQRALLLEQVRYLMTILEQLQAEAEFRDETIVFDPATQRLGGSQSVIEFDTYIDYYSPFSKQFHTTLQRLVAEYDGQFSVNYKHFPLELLYSGTTNVSRLMVCVGHIGGQQDFITLSDKALLYEPITEMISYNELYMTALDLVSQARLDACLASEFAASVVQSDFDIGVERGVQGVPMTYISVGGQETLLNGAQPYETTRRIVDNLVEQLTGS